MEPTRRVPPTARRRRSLYPSTKGRLLLAWYTLFFFIFLIYPTTESTLRCLSSQGRQNISQTGEGYILECNAQKLGIDLPYIGLVQSPVTSVETNPREVLFSKHHRARNAVYSDFDPSLYRSSHRSMYRSSKILSQRRFKKFDDSYAQLRMPTLKDYITDYFLFISRYRTPNYWSLTSLKKHLENITNKEHRTNKPQSRDEERETQTHYPTEHPPKHKFIENEVQPTKNEHAPANRKRETKNSNEERKTNLRITPNSVLCRQKVKENEQSSKQACRHEPREGSYPNEQPSQPARQVTSTSKIQTLIHNIHASSPVTNKRHKIKYIIIWIKLDYPS